MTLAITRAYLVARVAVTTAVDRIRNSEHGEGVISAAIAVLVMAFIGAAMWVAFNNVFQDAANKTQEQVRTIGGGGGGNP